MLKIEFHAGLKESRRNDAWSTQGHAETQHPFSVDIELFSNVRGRYFIRPHNIYICVADTADGNRVNGYTGRFSLLRDQTDIRGERDTCARSRRGDVIHSESYA